jgi:hypothetical protein
MTSGLADVVAKSGIRRAAADVISLEPLERAALTLYRRTLRSTQAASRKPMISRFKYANEVL